MKDKIIITISLLLIAFHLTSGDQNSALTSLINNTDWELIYEFEDSVKVYTKKLPDKGLKAYRVSKFTNIDREKLFKVFEDVKNYEQILTSATKMDFGFIRAEQDTLYGHQHINIPLAKDRHYVYKLIKHSPTKSYAHWILMDKEGAFSEFIQNKADTSGSPIYIEEGLGVFQVQELRDNSRRVSYSLYMDPGGWLPNFLINKSNRKGLVGMLRDVVREAKKLEQQ